MDKKIYDLILKLNSDLEAGEKVTFREIAKLKKMAKKIDSILQTINTIDGEGIAFKKKIKETIRDAKAELRREIKKSKGIDTDSLAMELVEAIEELPIDERPDIRKLKGFDELAKSIASINTGGGTVSGTDLSVGTKTKTTLGLNTESTYDWENEEWSVPINATVSQLMKVGKLPVQMSGGVRYWADSPDNGPEDWGFRLQLTFLFPR